MKELKIFKNENFGEIRTMTINDEPYFVGKDVAGILGYRDTSDALKRHVDEEDKLTRRFTDSGQNREMYIINESGVYSLILSSKMPQAKPFKRWVTSEVLPDIRRHGMYATEELLENPDIAIAAFTALKEEREKNKALQAENNEMKPKALFAEAVTASKTSVLIGELAKILRQNGMDIGQNRLFEKLRNDGYLVKGRYRSDRNMPTQKAMDMGLFEIKETTITHADGHISVNKTVKVTGKGQVYLVNKLLGNSQPA